MKIRPYLRYNTIALLLYEESRDILTSKAMTHPVFFAWRRVPV